MATATVMVADNARTAAIAGLPAVNPSIAAMVLRTTGGVVRNQPVEHRNSNLRLYHRINDELSSQRTEHRELHLRTDDGQLNQSLEHPASNQQKGAAQTGRQAERLGPNHLDRGAPGRCWAESPIPNHRVGVSKVNCWARRKRPNLPMDTVWVGSWERRPATVPLTVSPGRPGRVLRLPAPVRLRAENPGAARQTGAKRVSLSPAHCLCSVRGGKLYLHADPRLEQE